MAIAAKREASVPHDLAVGAAIAELGDVASLTQLGVVVW